MILTEFTLIPIVNQNCQYKTARDEVTERSMPSLILLKRHIEPNRTTVGKELNKRLRFRSDPVVDCMFLYCFCTKFGNKYV